LNLDFETPKTAVAVRLSTSFRITADKKSVNTAEEINQIQTTVSGEPTETMETSLIDNSELAELEAELEALENELNSNQEMDEPDMTGV